MFKSGIKTIICTLFFALILFIILQVHFYKTLDKENLYKDSIDINNELVVALSKRVALNDELRIPYFTNEEIDNERLIKYIVMGALPYDSTTMEISPVKIVCQVTDKITFTSSSNCEIKKIANSSIEYYKQLYFNSTQELEYVDFDYQGYTCKNDGLYYYCLKDSYYNNYKSKSLVDSAYIYDNKIVIYEYYYLTTVEEGKEYIEPTDDQIKKEGTLYKHTFIRNPDIPENEVNELNYYLAESIVVTE